MSHPLPGPGLYAVTPDWDDTDRLVAHAEQVLAGGAVMLQYRHTTASVRLRLTQATRLRQLCARWQRPFIVNDSIKLCIAVDADGVHLGRDDTPLAEARAWLGPERLIGATCLDRIEHARAAERAGADYVAFGGFFASPRKPYAPTTPPARIAEAVQQVRLPVTVIGGMTANNCAPLIAQGARWVAAIGAVFDCADSRVAAQAFTDRFAPAVQSSTL